MVLMSKEVLGIIGIILVVAAYLPYIIDIIKNRVKPHPFSWLIWATTSGCIFVLQLLHGSGSGAYPSGVVSIFALTITLLAFSKSKVVIKTLDVICLTLALTGIVFWLVVQQPLLSIALLLTVDVIGFIPTLIKGWSKPYEDSMSLWGINFLRHSAGFAAIHHYNFITILNPLVWMALSSSLCVMLAVRRLDTKKARNRKRVFRPQV